MPLIFISHAVVDKIIIDDFYDLLQMGCNLSREEIFCSSVEGAGIETGQDFTDWIHKTLNESEFVILFLTESYYASRFCVAEMGAAWALEKDVFPLVVPGIERDPGSVMLGRQTVLVDESGLDNLRDRIAKHHPSASEATARWSLKKDKFLRKFREKISELPKPPMVHRKLLEEEKERTVEAMKMNEQLTEETRRLDDHVKLLEKAKDAQEVKKIRAKYESEDTRYNELLKRVKEELRKLTRPEVRSAYASTIEQPWSPSREVWQDWDKEIERAVQSKWIEAVGMEKDAYQANEDHPRMRSVFEALRDLDDFISSCPPETITRMEEEKKCYIDIDNRQYWEEELVQIPLLD
jgi:hypothetical protein